MNYFGSKHFYNFLKNKKSFNIINMNNINKIKAICLNKIDTRALVTIKKSGTANSILLSICSSPSVLSQLSLSNLSKVKSGDIDGKINYKLRA